MRSKIKAILFDFDGTILDTETPAYEAWQSIFADHGTTLPLSMWSQSIGTNKSDFDPFEYLQERTCKSLDRDTVQRVRRARNRALIAKQGSLPGVSAWLDEARALGIPCAIASSSPREWIVPLLERLSLTGFFSVIATADDVSRTKPDPAVFLLAASKLGVIPSEAVAVEDSAHGVRASVAAGAFTVAVPNQMTAAQDFSAANVVLASLANATIADVAQSAARQDIGH
jgi:HAD superfamily hydrolase (TIGR01509 family)